MVSGLSAPVSLIVAGPEGAALAELFAPPRADWSALDRLPAAPVTLPG